MCDVIVKWKNAGGGDYISITCWGIHHYNIADINRVWGGKFTVIQKAEM